jgi:hypothetical protein
MCRITNERQPHVILRERCHGLARRARNELGLEPLTPDSEEFFRQMVTLRVPEAAPKDLQERLYDKYRIEIPVFDRGDERFIRASFQGYNDAADFERLKSAIHEPPCPVRPPRRAELCPVRPPSAPFSGVAFESSWRRRSRCRTRMR